MKKSDKFFINLEWGLNIVKFFAIIIAFIALVILGFTSGYFPFPLPLFDNDVETINLSVRILDYVFTVAIYTIIAIIVFWIAIIDLFISQSIVLRKEKSMLKNTDITTTEEKQ